MQPVDLYTEFRIGKKNPWEEYQWASFEKEHEIPDTPRKFFFFLISPSDHTYLTFCRVCRFVQKALSNTIYKMISLTLQNNRNIY